MARAGAFPHFTSPLTCCYAKSICQSLNWRSLHSCITTSLGKIFTLQSWLTPHLQLSLLKLHSPGYSLQCGMDSWLRERSTALGGRNTHTPDTATQNDSLPDPGKHRLIFCIWFHYFPSLECWRD